MYECFLFIGIKAIDYKNIEQYKKYIIIGQYEYDLISSAYYYYKGISEVSDKQKLINTNLDSLCHDNQDSTLYRKLMMYNFIKKTISTILTRKLRIHLVN